MIRWAAYVSIVLGLLAAGAWAMVHAGVSDIGADEPHWRMTTRVLGAIRDRSIAVRASGLVAPNLADPDLIALGAEHYAEMCTGCHLTPGSPDTELRRGLNPQPPRLALPGGRTPAEVFWIIKHGIRMTAMPAWGATHDDRAIWGLVAFVRKLPTLDAAGYAKLTGETGHESHGHGADEQLVEPGMGDDMSNPGDGTGHDHGAGHAHDHADGGGHDH